MNFKDLDYKKLAKQALLFVVIYLVLVVLLGLATEQFTFKRTGKLAFGAFTVLAASFLFLIKPNIICFCYR